MRTFCWFGFHDWGKQNNIRNTCHKDDLFMMLPFFFIYAFLGSPKVCDRKCLRCGKVKEFSYDSQRG